LDLRPTEAKPYCDFSIAIASVGQQRLDIVEKLLPYVLDETNSMEVAATAALSLGFIFAGSGAGDIAGDIVQAIMERDEKALNEKWARFMGVALGLIFLGAQCSYLSLVSS
jgi:26S proteasome regulatory subunit N1